MQTFILQADKSLIAKIKGLFKATNNEAFMQELTKEQIEALEDLELARMGDEAYKEFLASGEQSIPADEVFKELGI